MRKIRIIIEETADGEDSFIIPNLILKKNELCPICYRIESEKNRYSRIFVKSDEPDEFQEDLK